MGYNTGDKQLIKEINKASIFQVVHDIGPVSRADIAKILKLTSATVSRTSITKTTCPLLLSLAGIVK